MTEGIAPPAGYTFLGSMTHELKRDRAVNGQQVARVVVNVYQRQ